MVEALLLPFSAFLLLVFVGIVPKWQRRSYIIVVILVVSTVMTVAEHFYSIFIRMENSSFTYGIFTSILLLVYSLIIGGLPAGASAYGASLFRKSGNSLKKKVSATFIILISIAWVLMWWWYIRSGFN